MSPPCSADQALCFSVRGVRPRTLGRASDLKREKVVYWVNFADSRVTESESMTLTLWLCKFKRMHICDFFFTKMLCMMILVLKGIEHNMFIEKKGCIPVWKRSTHPAFLTFHPAPSFCFSVVYFFVCDVLLFAFFQVRYMVLCAPMPSLSVAYFPSSQSEMEAPDGHSRKSWDLPSHLEV